LHGIRLVETAAVGRVLSTREVRTAYLSWQHPRWQRQHPRGQVQNLQNGSLCLHHQLVEVPTSCS